jgi:hypothetical protein
VKNLSQKEIDKETLELLGCPSKIEPKLELANISYYSDTIKEYKGSNFALLILPERHLDMIVSIQHFETSGLVQKIEQGGFLFISQATDGSIAIIVRPTAIGTTHNSSKLDKDNFLVLNYFSSPNDVNEKHIRNAVIFMLNYSLVTSFVFYQTFKWTNWFCFCNPEVRFKLKLPFYHFKSWWLSYNNKDIQILKLAIRPILSLALSFIS